MSSHCSRYPTCKCPSDIGGYCHTDYSIREIIELNEGKLVEKTDGSGISFPVINPERYTYNEGGLRKIRRRPTNITPKKKKRK